MRSYLLTERERKILKTYIEENVKLDGFSVLSLRLKRWKRELVLNDLELMDKAFRKLESEQKPDPSLTTQGSKYGSH
jgi:hypothetical protein